MINLIKNGVWLLKNRVLIDEADPALQVKLGAALASDDKHEGAERTMARRILAAHDDKRGRDDMLHIKFDAMASHDITYVGIVQTARASGFDKFPIPYVLTNCHNSLCAVGGTINEDDHVFGLSAAKKYGGIYVPAHQAVIHSYMREMMTGCGKMIIGSDSHTRYGALGTLAVGEGGPELVKQLLEKTYDIQQPEIVAVYLDGEVRPGVGAQDVAIAIIGAVFKNGFVKNRVMEFVGPGIGALSVDFRCGIDVMTTETTCLSSIWTTDEKVREYYAIHGREDAYRSLTPGDAAYYDRAILVNLSEIEPMIALPFHPSNAYTIAELNKNPYDILKKTEDDAAENIGGNLGFSLLSKIHDGAIWADQGIIAGCAGGTFENLMISTEILAKTGCPNTNFALNVYPGSQPIYAELAKNGALASLISAGANVKTAFCGPCFGAGDVPANNGFSVRHTTRNFPNREGSKPSAGQLASVALMDARSVAATAANGGRITAGTEMMSETKTYAYHFDKAIYERRIYDGYGKPMPEEKLVFGPNIADWPEQKRLAENMLLKLASVIRDPVTTTDELIPSGETSSYRSNPIKLSEFTLSRKDPEYVGRAKTIKSGADNIMDVLKSAARVSGIDANTENTAYVSAIYAHKPGDGSAREQAASCQRVLGGGANIAQEYATKRYRSNLINWGMLPFALKNYDDHEKLSVGAYVFVPRIRNIIETGESDAVALVIIGEKCDKIELSLGSLTDEERRILLAGCLINHYRK